MITYEYDILLSLAELQEAGALGWRLHTVTTEIENQQTIYVVERQIFTVKQETTHTNVQHLRGVAPIFPVIQPQ